MVSLAEFDERERVFKGIDERIKALIVRRQLTACFEFAICVLLSRRNASGSISCPEEASPEDTEPSEPEKRSRWMEAVPDGRSQNDAPRLSPETDEPITAGVFMIPSQSLHLGEHVTCT